MIKYYGLKNIAFMAFIPAVLYSCRKDAGVNSNTPETVSALSAQQQSASAASRAGYQLVWADEFDAGLDSTKWTVSTGNLNIRHELQAYARANVNVRNGFLNLLAEKKTTDGQAFTSGKITTADKFTTRYGRIEARIKLPAVPGLAAEFSLLGLSPAGWAPESGEIDVMQHINRDNRVLGGIQWENSGHAIYRGNSPDGYYFDYHVYAVEWDPQEIRWFVDGKQYFKANIADGVNSTEEFHKPFYINLNLAVGGDLAGMTVDRNLPTSMVVDYVRVYTLSPSASRNHITA